MTIFDILKASLFSNTTISLPTDFQPLFEEMKQQTVEALPYNILPAEAKQWRAYCMKKTGQAIRVLHAQDQLISLLESNGICCVIIKGAAAAMYYPHPTLRSMGDVDFLVKRCDLERAAKLLEENGYSLVHDKEQEKHHYGYKKDKISFELHWRIPLISEDDEKRMAFFEEGIDHREWHEIEGYKFPVLPTLLNGLVLIFHINQHLRSGLGLRQIIDWMMYVHKLTAEEWEELIPLLKQNGVDKLARTVTVLCQRHLGLPQIIDDDASLPVDELLAYVLEKGNFGHKLPTVEASIDFYTNTGAVMFFNHLQAGGLSRWKAAQKHKILRPFAWIYQSFRIVGVLVKNKKTPAAVLKQAQHGADQRQLIEALGLKMDRMIEI